MAGLRVVIVNGPRQSGKTTLLRMYQEQATATYVTLDDAFQLDQALADPATYVRQGPAPLIIDEVQRGGDALIRAVKIVVDERQDRGQYILSGSAKFLTVPTLSESLAGRAGFVYLWPLSVSERTGAPADFTDRLFSDPASLLGRRSSWERDDYLRLVTTGGYPEVLTIPVQSVRESWYEGYLSTVIVRDIADFASLRDADVLPKVLNLVAARSGSQMVYSDLARGLGIQMETVRRYLAYLERVFLATTVPAWPNNLTSKVTKTPKVFVTDSGLAAHLLGASASALRVPGHPALGGLLETFVLAEIVKLQAAGNASFSVYHFRDRTGVEADFLLESNDGTVVAVEVKATASPTANDAKHLRWLKGRLGDRMRSGIVMHLGTDAGSFGDGIYALPLSAMWRHHPLPS